MLQVRMVRTPDVPDVAHNAAFFGVEELVRELSGFPPDVRDHGVDGWLYEHFIPERNQIDVSGPLTRLETEHGKYDVDPHIDVVLTGYDLCDVTVPNLRFCVGIARGNSAIVSVHQFLAFLASGETELFHELVKQETAHELGHVLGLAVREHDTYESLGGHCVFQECVMHQGLTVPTDWLNAVQYRLGNGRYACPLCHEDAHRNGML